MSITIDLKMLLLIIICVAVVVLAVYLVKLLKKLTVTMENANKVLEDVSVMTEIAANRSKDVDGIISNVSESVSGIAEAVKGKQNALAALAAVIKAAIAVKNAADKEKEKEYICLYILKRIYRVLKGVRYESYRNCKKS